MTNYAKRFDFGLAICALKEGKRVAREGWNGKGMWLELVLSIRNIPAGGTDMPVYRLTGAGAGSEPKALPWIGMKTAQNEFVPWLASQADMLADDWMLVE